MSPNRVRTSQRRAGQPRDARGSRRRQRSSGPANSALRQAMGRRKALLAAAAASLTDAVPYPYSKFMDNLDEPNDWGFCFDLTGYQQTMTFYGMQAKRETARGGRAPFRCDGWGVRGRRLGCSYEKCRARTRRSGGAAANNYRRRSTPARSASRARTSSSCPCSTKSSATATRPGAARESTMFDLNFAEILTR